MTTPRSLARLLWWPRRGRLPAATLGVAFAAAALAGCPSERPDKPDPNGLGQITAGDGTGVVVQPEPLITGIDGEGEVDRGALRTPWARAEVGDWAEYRTPTGTLRVEVVAVGPGSVTVERGGERAKVMLADEERAWVLENNPFDLDPERFSTSFKMHEVAGRELPVLVVSPRGGAGDEVWYSEELPLEDGVVLRRENGATVLELVAFGQAAEGAPRGAAVDEEASPGPGAEGS